MLHFGVADPIFFKSGHRSLALAHSQQYLVKIQICAGQLGTDAVDGDHCELAAHELKIFGIFRIIKGKVKGFQILSFIFKGDFIASGTTNNNRAKALGNGAGNDVWLFEGATINIANNKGNITIATSSQLWNFGGTLTTDSGSQIAVSCDQP